MMAGGRKRTKGRELMGCHDCGGAVSFSADACPHCGSREHSGPRTVIRDRIEQRNDQTLVAMLLLCSFAGVFWGAATGGIFSLVGYGLLGFLIGVPAGFVVNLSRRLFS